MENSDFYIFSKERVQKECKNKNTEKYFPLDHNFFSFTDFTKVLDEISIDLVSLEEEEKEEEEPLKENVGRFSFSRGQIEMESLIA